MNTAPQNYSYNPFSYKDDQSVQSNTVESQYKGSLAVSVVNNDKENGTKPLDDFYNHANFVLTVICGSFGILLLIIVGMVGGDKRTGLNDALLETNNIVSEQSSNDVLGITDSSFALSLKGNYNLHPETYNEIIFSQTGTIADKPIYFKADFDRFLVMENVNVTLLNGVYTLNPNENGDYVVQIFPKISTDLDLRIYDSLIDSNVTYDYTFHVID